MSGETPEWWVNSDFVDASQLCSDPSYLNEMSDKVDEWINSLLPTENVKETSSFVMENKFNVVLKEQLQGIPVGTTGVIVIRDDFRTVTIDFIGNDGKTVRINETPEKLLQIIDVIGSSDNV